MGSLEFRVNAGLVQEADFDENNPDIPEEVFGLASGCGTDRP